MKAEDKGTSHEMNHDMNHEANHEKCDGNQNRKEKHDGKEKSHKKHDADEGNREMLDSKMLNIVAFKKYSLDNKKTR